MMRNIKNKKKKARFPKPIKFDPNQWDHNLWCEYRETHSHKTGDYWHLEEVAKLFKNDHLREFLSDRAKKNYGRSWDKAEPTKTAEDSPWLTINMIFGGNKISVTFSVVKKINI